MMLMLLGCVCDQSCVPHRSLSVERFCSNFFDDMQDGYYVFFFIRRAGGGGGGRRRRRAGLAAQSTAPTSAFPSRRGVAPLAAPHFGRGVRPT
jgi:hypothetical protein